MKWKKARRGYSGMIDNGHKAVRCFFDAAEWQAVEKAAKEAGLPVATYVRRAAFEVSLRTRFRVTRDGFVDYGPGS